MFPTMKHLEAIGRFGCTADLMAAAVAAEVPDILPRITVDGPGVRIVLPGDDGYEDATGLPPGMAFPDRPQGLEIPQSAAGGPSTQSAGPEGAGNG
jgi:hypothetical protein